MKYVVGNSGRLAQYLVEKTNGTLIKPSECSVIPREAQVLYTSAFTANYSIYVSSPMLVLKDNAKHLYNIVNLLERGCDIVYTGSDQGYYFNGCIHQNNSVYSYSKLFLSNLAEIEYDYGSLTNLVIPSIIGRKPNESQQLFEEVILRAISDYDSFMQTYLQNAENESVKSFVTIEDLNEHLNAFLSEPRQRSGNIFIEPTFVETISSFYKAVLRVLIEKQKPTTHLENYILEKVGEYEMFTD